MRTGLLSIAARAVDDADEVVATDWKFDDDAPIFNGNVFVVGNIDAGRLAFGSHVFSASL